MSLKTTRWRFWVVTVVTLATMALTSSLTLWQLDRAAEKEGLAQQRIDRQSLPSIGWGDLLSQDPEGWPALLDRTVELQGSWKHEATIFLDNRPMNGRAGFLVVTPLSMRDHEPGILVVRGWVPRRLDDRTALPVLAETSEPVAVVGRLAPPPSKLYDFGQPGEGRIRQNIDLNAFGAEWSMQLLPVSIQQLDMDGSEAGLLRDWPVPDFDVHKHYGYAFQWFSLTVLLFILYVWFQFIAPRWRRVE